MSILILEHSDTSSAGRLAEVLRDFGHRLDIRRPDLGQPLPPDLDHLDGIISTGGPYDPADQTLPWMTAELTFLQQASAAEIPLIGLCLGCQLLARALGGEVGPMEKGEFGWHPITLTEAGKIDPIHAGIGWTTIQPHWHSSEVKKLPPGCTLLASSARCKVQAFSLGTHLYAFQYHPEILGRELTHWADDRPDQLKAAGLTREQLIAQTDQHLDTCQRLALRMFTTIATCLMPIDRRYAGIPKGQRYT